MKHTFQMQRTHTLKFPNTEPGVLVYIYNPSTREAKTGCNEFENWATE